MSHATRATVILSAAGAQSKDLRGITEMLPGFTLCVRLRCTFTTLRGHCHPERSRRICVESQKCSRVVRYALDALCVHNPKGPLSS
jgi:hypothetical protein